MAGCSLSVLVATFGLLLINFANGPGKDTLLPLVAVLALAVIVVLLAHWYQRALRLRAEDNLYRWKKETTDA